MSASEVTLAGKGKKRNPLSLYVVYVKEQKPPEKQKGLEWLLLTNLPVSDYTEARMIIEWHRCRWEIETYSRVIKGSCNIETFRLRTEDKQGQLPIHYRRPRLTEE